MSPVFSVIVPTFNRATMLRTALKTIQWQTFQDWECLVVDDGSTDATPAVLDSLGDDARLRRLRNEKNIGMNASRNRAIEQARGEFVTFLDSDDLWLPGRLEIFRRRAQEKKEAGFLFSNAYLWRYGRIIGALFAENRPIPAGVVPGHYAVGADYLPYVTTNVAIRGETFRRLGLFNTRMRTLDTELFARFLASGVAVGAIREPVSVRRIHGEQLTDHYEENFRESLLALEASGVSGAEMERRKKELVFEVAGYLWRALRPESARQFLLRHLGQKARSCNLYKKTFIPSPVLSLAKQARKAYLMARHNRLWAPPDVRAVYSLIDPLITTEAENGV